MNVLAELIASDHPAVTGLIAGPEVTMAAWDNRPTWDNWAKAPAPFDNRPTWDNWKKK